MRPTLYTLEQLITQFVYVVWSLQYYVFTFHYGLASNHCEHCVILVSNLTRSVYEPLECAMQVLPSTIDDQLLTRLTNLLHGVFT